MPMPIKPRLLTRKFDYLLEDRFEFDKTAGSLNGTLSTGGQLRAVVDTAGTKISIASGVLNFATGATINDAVRYPVQARQAGRLLYWRVTPSDTNGIINLGWDANTSGAITDYLSFAAAGILQIIANGGTAFNVGVYTAVTYEVISTMRGTGLFWYLKGGAFTYYTLLGATALGTAAAYPAVGVGSATSIFTVG